MLYVRYWIQHNFYQNQVNRSSNNITKVFDLFQVKLGRTLTYENNCKWCNYFLVVSIGSGLSEKSQEDKAFENVETFSASTDDEHLLR